MLVEIDLKAKEPVGWRDTSQGVPGPETLDWLRMQARFGVPVWAVCLSCDYSSLLSADHLLALVKPTTTDLSVLRARMRCRACGSKDCDLRAATPVPEYCS